MIAIIDDRPVLSARLIAAGANLDLQNEVRERRCGVWALLKMYIHT